MTSKNLDLMYAVLSMAVYDEGYEIAKIAEQIKANVFPVRLAPEDWTSGDIVWLLDLIAADRKQATSVLANFRQVAGQRPVKIAPLVARLIDPEVAERLRGAGSVEKAANGSAKRAELG